MIQEYLTTEPKTLGQHLRLKRAKQIEAYIKANGQRPITEIADHVGCCPNTAYKTYFAMIGLKTSGKWNGGITPHHG